jgi:hypothetical protein
MMEYQFSRIPHAETRRRKERKEEGGESALLFPHSSSLCASAPLREEILEESKWLMRLG